jgi:hypothetical protein
MARDQMDVLLTIRRRAVDKSRQALAGCLKVEAAALEAVRAIDAAVMRERAFADRFPEQPHRMEVFALWSERVAAERLGAVAALAYGESQTVAARAVLASARSAARAVERTIEERAALARAEAEAEKRDQHAMDDITRGCRITPGPREDGDEPQVTTGLTADGI